MSKHSVRVIALFVALLSAATGAFASTASDFYLGMLKRGIANYDAGHYDDAARELEIAAFGLIESVDHFETAKIYATLANDKLERAPRAKSAAQRVLAAERVSRRFAQLSLPNEVRNGFISTASRLLTPAEAQAFSGGSPLPPPAPQQQPKVKTQTPATATKPAPTPQPQTSAQSQPETKAAPKVIEQKTVTFPAPRDTSFRLADADRLLAEKKLPEAQAIYRDLVTTTTDRKTLLSAGEGAYRARDFATAVRAYDRAGKLGKGEEPYHFYLAVALFETGDVTRAKRELAAALPYIEMTPSVAWYRDRIQGATVQ